MSTAIEEKVVEMRFDNKDFEKNVSTTMTTLEKLKAALKFDGISEAFNKVKDAVGGLDVSPISDGVDDASGSFSAFETIAAGVLLRLGSEIVDVGKKIVDNLVIDQISSGWQKFADKTTAVGTLMSQGFSMDEVNEQLDKLMFFTDETSYNFVDMVSTIGKFTASGQNLQDSTTALMGIANWAALSGQNASVASRAMYQLAQAMSVGALKYQDYKSIQNANMDTMEFRQQAAQAAMELGQLRQEADGTYSILEELDNGLINVAASGLTLNDLFTSETLTRQAWLDSETMMKVFNQYASAVDTIKAYADANDVTASEAIEALSKQLDPFAVKAFKAAQEARTFADSINSIKDAASSGFTAIFESVFGDYEEATKLWTDLANRGYDAFVEPINSLGELLQGGLQSGWKSFGQEISLSSGMMARLKEILISVAESKGLDVSGLVEGGDAFVQALHSGVVSSDILGEAIETLRLEYAGMTKEELNAIGMTRSLRSDFASFIQGVRSGTISVDDLADSIASLSGRENLIQGFWNIWDRISDTLSTVKEAFQEIFPPATSEQIYEITQKIFELTSHFIKFHDEEGELTEEGRKLSKFFQGLFSILRIGKKIIDAVLKGFKPLVEAISGGSGDVLDFAEAIGDFLLNFEAFLDDLGIFDGISSVISTVVSVLVTVFRFLGEKILPPVVNAFSSVGKVVEKLITGGFSGLGKIAESIATAFDKLFGSLDFSGIDAFIEKIGELFSGLTDLSSATDFELPDFSSLKDATSLDEIFSGVFGTIGGGAAAVLGGVWGILKQLVPGVTKSLSPVLTTTREWLVDIYEVAVEFVDGIIDYLPQAFEKAKGLVTDLLTAIQKVLDSDTGEITSLIFGIIETILTKLSGYIDQLSDVLTTKGSDGKSIIERVLGSVSRAIISFLEESSTVIVDFITKLAEIISENAPAVVTAVTLVLTSVITALAGSDETSGLIGVVVDLFVLVCNAIVKNIDQLVGAISAVLLAIAGAIPKLIGPIVQVVIAVFSSLADEVEKNSDLVDSFVDLFTKLFKAFLMVDFLTILGDIAKGLRWATGGFSDFAAAAKLSAIGPLMIQFATAIAILAGALLLLYGVVSADGPEGFENLEKTLWLMGQMVAMILASDAIFTLIGKMGKTAKGAGMFLLLFAAAVWILTDAVVKLMTAMTENNISAAEAFGWVALVAVLALVLGIAGQLLSEASQTISKMILSLGVLLIGVGMVGIGVLGIAAALYIISEIPKEKMLPAAGAVAIIAVVLVGIVVMMSLIASTLDPIKPATLLAMLGIAVIMSLAIAGLAAVVFGIAILIPEDRLWPAVGALAVIAIVLAALIAVTAWASKQSATVLKASAAFIVIALAIGLIAAVIWALSSIENVWQGVEIAGGIAAVLAVLLVLAAALSEKTDEIMQFALAADALAGAIAVVAFAIWVLSTIDDISQAMTAIGVFILIVAAAVTAASLLGPAGVATLLSFAGAMNLIALAFIGFAAAILILGVAIPLLVSAIELLESKVSTIVGTLTAFIVEICAAIPIWAFAIGEAISLGILSLIAGIITGFDEGIAEIAHALGIGKGDSEEENSFFKMAGDWIAGLWNAFAKKASETWTKIKEFYQGIIDKILDFLGIKDTDGNEDNSFWKIAEDWISGLVQGFKDKITETWGKIKDWWGKIIDNIKSFLGIGDGDSEDSNSFFDIAKNLIDGFIQGIKNKINDAIDGIKEFGDKIVGGLKDILGIESPSKVTREMGEYLDEGLAIGITSGAKSVAKKAEKMAESVLHGFEDGMENDGYDFEPTIRPILDLDNVSNSAAMLNDLFSDQNSVQIAADTRISVDDQLDKLQNGITVNNSDVIREMNSLHDEVSTLKDTIRDLQVVLDSGELVGAMAGSMDTALGRRYSNRLRGM